MAISLRGQEATTERRIFEDIKTKRTYFLSKYLNFLALFSRTL